LTPTARPGLVCEVVAGWTRTEAARRFRVSRATVAKQLRRYRDKGWDGLRDRCSRLRRERGRGAVPHRLGLGRGALRPPTPSSAGPVSTVATARRHRRGRPRLPPV